MSKATPRGPYEVTVEWVGPYGTRAEVHYYKTLQRAQRLLNKHAGKMDSRARMRWVPLSPKREV